MILHIILIILGFILLIKGADFLVDGASEIAKKFHIPEIVIGLTIVAIGTSMPELVVSVKSALEGHSDLAIGNIIGSNLANMFLILGVCSMIKPLIFKKETKLFEMPFTIFVTTLLFVFCIFGNDGENIQVITRYEGVILLLFCFIFILYNLFMAKKGESFNSETIIEIKVEENKEKDTWEAIIKIIIGIIGLKIGGDLVVDGSIEIARMLGITEKVISLTIVAFSTSLPELITSITATIKGDIDMAIGNVLGSQIFNILLIIGLSAVLNPIVYSSSYNSNIILLIAGSILLALYPFIGEKNKMTKSNGIIFVVTYILYIGSLVCTM